MKSRRNNRRRRDTRRRRYKRRSSRQSRTGGGLSDILPTTTWGQWSSMPGALAWSPTSVAPAPLANGGLFTGAQSTGPWASQPFPATQYAMSVEAAKLTENPVVFYQQRATDNVGGSWSPYVGQAHTPQHWSARMPSLPGLANVK